jgi:Tol biopolymer transport system component
MGIESGQQLLHYHLTEKIGEGGMGQVYRATDTKLKRDVAIKFLPAAFTEDRERLARFEREAQLLAQLHHPNIASIFGLEESGGVRALVMELVEGPTLAARLEPGSLSLDESLSIARQIAEALEEAHERGIIHRDLKPQNIKAPTEGKVKILDFGLAKAMDPAAGSAASGADMTPLPALTQSPTLTAAHGTQLGVILGTAAYMSPEQARGGAVDKRADIWAFGVVLYEMLSGRSLFSADTVSDTLAGVLKTEIDFAKLPASTPPAIRRLLRRCLERNPKNRLHDIADARIVIDEVLVGDAQESEATPVTVRNRSWLPWAMAAAGVAIAMAALLIGGLTGKAAPSGQLTRTSVLMPFSGKADLSAGNFAMSPDGGAIVFLASDATGTRLFVRDLAETEPRPLAGTDGARFPFWSGDSQQIAFFAGSSLLRVPRGGGAVQTICAAKDGRGGAWNREGTIVFAADFRDAPLYQVSASGGAPAPATVLDVENGEISHRFPSFLPDGRHFLFGVEPGTAANRFRIKLASLEAVSSGKPLLEASAVPNFASPSQLVFPRDAALMVQSIDLGRLEMVGEAQLLEERPSFRAVVTSTPIVEVAYGGRMLYAPVDPRPTSFVWLERNGRRSESGVQEEGLFSFPAVSHRGNRVVVTKGGSFAEGSLWIFDLDHGGGLQITPRDQSAYAAVWSPDDRDLAANLTPGDSFTPAWIAAESGTIRTLLEPSKRWINPTDVSADGQIMLYDDQTAGMKMNLGYLRLGVTPERADYLMTPANELGGRLSPDGRYIAYLSDVSGTTEVYVDTFPKPARARRINTGGVALQVDFRSDGEELFILAADGDRAALYASELQSGGELEIGRPQKLFTLPVEWSGFAPAPKGDRFLLLESVGNRSPSLTLVDNWRAQLAPAR